MADIEQIKSKVDIVEIVSKYVDLKNAGSNYKGVCPFHQEKTPSFMVNPSLQIYKCFGCGKGGDVFNFIQDIERVDFTDALKQVAEIAGIEIDDIKFQKNEKLEKEKKRIHQANELATRFYNHILKTHKIGKKARDYARKRQVGAKEIEKFQFGYAPNNKKNLKNFLNKKGFKDEELLEIGLIVERRNEQIDKFRNRLMQPIYDLKGNVIGFSGRYIGDYENAPKYLNSSESAVYKKNEILYGLYQAKDEIRKANKVIVVEGNIDIVSSHRIGVENIVAPLGTAFTANQAKLLKRFADEILFCFDTDSAGINALIRSIEIVENLGLQHKVINLGEFQDADELILKDSKLWPKKIEGAVDTFDYLKSKLSEDLDLGSASGKLTFEKRIIPIIKFYKNKVELNQRIKEVSLILEITQEELKDKLNKNKSAYEYRLKEEKPNDKAEKKEVDKTELYFLSLILQNGDKINFKINENIFTDVNIQQLVRDFINDSLDHDSLSQEAGEIFDEASLTDLSEIEDIEKQIKKTYRILYKEYLKTEVMKLRKRLAVNEEDEDLLNELSKLTIEMREYL